MFAETCSTKEIEVLNFQAGEVLDETFSLHKIQNDQRSHPPIILKPQTDKIIIEKHNCIFTSTATNKLRDTERNHANIFSGSRLESQNLLRPCEKI